MRRTEAASSEWPAARTAEQIANTDQLREARDAHLKGEIARALFAKTEEIFSTPPQVEQGTILAGKTAHSWPAQTWVR